jgi:hypothetical protein
MHAAMIRNIRRSSTMALLLSPVGILIIAAARLLIIANYHMNSALAILASAGYVNTLLGTVFPLIPAFLPYLGLVLLYLNRVVASLLTFLATVLISPATMSRASAQALLLHDWQMAIGGDFWRHALLIALALPAAIFAMLALLGVGLQSATRAVGTVAIILLLPVIVRLYPAPLTAGFYTEIVRQPWLPAEALTLTSHQTVIAYKLDDSDGVWIEVLRADDRSVVYYKMADIAGRQLCQVATISSMRPVLTLVTGSSGSESCDSLLSDEPVPAPSAAPLFKPSPAMWEQSPASSPVITTGEG